MFCYHPEFSDEEFKESDGGVVTNSFLLPLYRCPLKESYYTFKQGWQEAIKPNDSYYMVEKKIEFFGLSKEELFDPSNKKLLDFSPFMKELSDLSKEELFKLSKE